MCLTSVHDWLVLGGRLHPLIVHFPIGILFLAAVLELMTPFRRFEQIAPILPVVWLVGFVSAVASCGAGFLLAGEGAYNEGLLQTHQWLGISVTVISGAAWAARTRVKRNRVLSILLASMTIIVLSATGHIGGSLTHGEDFLSEPIAGIFELEDETEWIAEARKPVVLTNETLIYEEMIQPILHEKCERCHNQKKRKGKLNLESYHLLMEGGKGGRVVTPGLPLESEMYRRLLLPLDEKKRMPPKNKTQLTNEELQLIEWWIAAGRASETVRLSEIPKSDTIQMVLASFDGSTPEEVGEEQTASYLPDETLSEIDESHFRKLRDQGIVVTRISADLPFVSINCVNVPDLDQQILNLLLPVKDYIVWFNAANTDLGDDGMDIVGQCSNLTWVNVSNTRVTDQGVARLNGVKKLVYLNLVGTLVTDRSVDLLGRHEHLSAVYLWKTRFSNKGIEMMKHKFPVAEVNFGEIPSR